MIEQHPSLSFPVFSIQLLMIGNNIAILYSFFMVEKNKLE